MVCSFVVVSTYNKGALPSQRISTTPLPYSQIQVTYTCRKLPLTFHFDCDLCGMQKGFDVHLNLPPLVSRMGSQIYVSRRLHDYQQGLIIRLKCQYNHYKGIYVSLAPLVTCLHTWHTMKECSCSVEKTCGVWQCPVWRLWHVNDTLTRHLPRTFVLTEVDVTSLYCGFCLDHILACSV